MSQRDTSRHPLWMRASLSLAGLGLSPAMTAVSCSAASAPRSPMALEAA